MKRLTKQHKTGEYSYCLYENGVFNKVENTYECIDCREDTILVPDEIIIGQVVYIIDKVIY